MSTETSTPAARPASPPPRAVRDPWFDNGKMLLVTLVVVGHSWSTLLPADAVGHPYDFLYTWHIPAFVFVTGYLSRTFTYTRARMWQLVRTVAVPYVVFECAMALFRLYVGGEQLDDLFRDPHWPMWYLAALFFWRLMTPVFRPMRGGLLVAIVLSLLAGRYAGHTLDMARVFGLLPFFVMGLKATPERLAVLRRRPAQVAAVCAFVGIWVATYWTDAWAGTDWLFYSYRYDELGADGAGAFLSRAVVLLLGTLGAWAFFALVPRTGGWFTRMGASTLVVYLFHGFLVKGIGYAGYAGWTGSHEAVGFVVTTLGAVGIALLLASPPVSQRLVNAVDPLGYAERHVSDAVALTAAKDTVQPEVEADVTAGVSAGAHVELAEHSSSRPG